MASALSTYGLGDRGDGSRCRRRLQLRAARGQSVPRHLRGDTGVCSCSGRAEPRGGPGLADGSDPKWSVPPGPSGLAGAGLAYLSYSYAIYLIGLPMNQCFLLYVAIETLTGAALIDGLVRIRPAGWARCQSRRLERGTGWFRRCGCAGAGNLRRRRPERAAVGRQRRLTLRWLGHIRAGDGPFLRDALWS